jgi:hypothetical protein
MVAITDCSMHPRARRGKSSSTGKKPPRFAISGSEHQQAPEPIRDLLSLFPQDNTCILLYLPGISASRGRYARHGIGRAPRHRRRQGGNAPYVDAMGASSPAGVQPANVPIVVAGCPRPTRPLDSSHTATGVARRRAWASLSAAEGAFPPCRPPLSRLLPLPVQVE